MSSASAIVVMDLLSFTVVGLRVGEGVAVMRFAKRVKFWQREVPESFFDMTPDQQIEWVTELLQGMAPKPAGAPPGTPQRATKRRT